MKITIAKPDWGITGGFELVVDRVIATLEHEGHVVDVATVPATEPATHLRGVDVSPDVAARSPEFFGYVGLLERFRELDVSGADVVLTTQPGSWAVEHDRKLALFYHHHRVAYDLEDRFVQAGLGDDRVHRSAARLIRELEAADLASIRHFLVPSETVMRRLERFNGVPGDRTSWFHAGPHHRADTVPETDGGTAGHVLCVSRSEFTKRTELFVAAAAAGFDAEAHLVGAGGRLASVRRLMSDLQRGVPRAEEPWWSPVGLSQQYEELPDAPVTIHGWTEADEVASLYANAAVVVAPAHDEDYGLTVLEAMSYGRPVVVCSDGGGLTELVDDGVDGVIAAPTPEAVAAAVNSLLADDDLRVQMRQAAAAKAASFSWERADRQLLEGLEAVVACA